MSNKLPPCTGGGKHKWSFRRNTTLVHRTLRTASFTLKGIYRCDICNAGKYGQLGNEPEANQENGHAE